MIQGGEERKREGGVGNKRLIKKTVRVWKEGEQNKQE